MGCGESWLTRKILTHFPPEVHGGSGPFITQ